MKRFLIIAFLFIPYLSIAQTEADHFQNSIIEKVIHYNNEISKRIEALKKARAEKSADTIKLDKEAKETVKKCFQVPQDFIAENPASPYGLQALKMLGTGSKNSPVQIADLERLFGSLKADIRYSEEGKAYAKNLKSWPWMNQLNSAAGTVFVKESLLPIVARAGLLNAVGKKVSITLSMHRSLQSRDDKGQGTSLLREEKGIDKVKAATLIVSMAYGSAAEGTLKVNPTTAYVIDESGICVTNYHVMKEYSGKDQYQSFSVMTAEGKAYPLAKILACSESDDLVVFQVATNGDKLPALPLGDAAPEGAAVHVMSHPIGSFYRFSSGRVTGYAAATLAGSSCKLMHITADFNVGSSGGPIVDGYGNVVGTVSRIVDGVKVGVPVSELRKLLVEK